MKIIMLGAPGAGKGTYGGEIAKKYGIPTMSSGQMFRDEISKGSELGKKVKSILESGKLVPDEITIKMMKKRMSEKDAKKGWILDGFPRTLAQAEALEKFAIPDVVLNIIVPKEILMEKMLARRTCPKCGAIYNLADINKTIGGKKYVLPPLLPKKKDICDKCGTKIAKRDDETPEIITNRFKIYDEQTAPLIEYYENEGLVQNVFVTAGKEEMVKKIFEMLQKMEAENG